MTRFTIPSGRFITSSPVIAGGAVYFGADDGCLYGQAPGSQLEAPTAMAPLHQPRSKTTSATGKSYSWPGPYGEDGNTSYLVDPGLKPPFQVRWIAPSHAGFKQPMVASETDVFFSSLEGTVAAYEQATGRLRWRRRVAGPAWCRQSLCYADGCLYVPRPGGYAKTNAFVPEGASQLHCLDVADGGIRWSVPLGGSPDSLSREAPICAKGVVTYPMLRKGTLLIQAWDARSGKEAWNIELGHFPAEVGVSGCVLDGTMYFSCQSSKVAGQTVAVDPNGKVVWRNTEYGGNSNLAGRDGKLLLNSAEKYTCCLSAKDGSLIWKHDEKATFWYAAAFGPDLVVGRRVIGWSRTNEAYRGDTGQPLRDDGKPLFMSPRDHGCGPVVLVSSGFTLSTATSGLFAVDVKTGQPVWNSPGFGSTACTNPAIANGRCFVNPQFSARIYCFEPISDAVPK